MVLFYHYPSKKYGLIKNFEQSAAVAEIVKVDILFFKGLEIEKSIKKYLTKYGMKKMLRDRDPDFRILKNKVIIEKFLKKNS